MKQLFIIIILVLLVSANESGVANTNTHSFSKVSIVYTNDKFNGININSILLLNMEDKFKDHFVLICIIVLLLLLLFIFYSKVTSTRLFIHQNKLRYVQEKELLETVEKLSKSDNLLNEAQRISKIAYLEKNLITGETIYSDNVWNMFEVSLKDKDKHLDYFNNLEFIYADDRQFYYDSVDKIKKEKKDNYTIEYRAITLKGNIINISSTGTRRLNSKGELEKLLLILQDITEQKKIENEIHTYERKYADVFRYSPTMLTISTLEDGVFLEVNNRFLYNLNYTREEVVGKSVKDIKIYHDYKDRYRIVALLKEKGYYSNFSTKFITKSGEVKDGLLSGSIIEINGQKLYLSICSDITDLKKAEDALKESDEKYKMIVDNTNDGIFIRSNGKITFTNSRLRDSLGFTDKELKNYCLDKLIHPDDLQMLRDSFANKIVTNKDAIIIEIRFITKDNQVRICEFTRKDIYIKGELATLGIVHDITNIRTAEMELRIFNKYLEEKVNIEIKKREQHDQALMQKTKLEFIGEMAAGMAHEINQPLTGITMGMDNILNKASSVGVDEVYLIEKIKTLFSYVKRIENIIEHVRTFSRDQQITIFEKFNINEAIENALLLVKKTYMNNNIEINYKSSTTLSSKGNKYKFEQVMLNLLSNAKDAILEKTKRQNGISYNNKINIVLLEDNMMNIIIVSDNGIGISEDKIENIYKPFYTTKEANKGTGLGLSIVYGIIKEMNGEIETESVVNEFTSMKILLPKLIE